MDNIQEFNEDSLKNNIISQRSPITGHSIFYIDVYKQSQSGLLYNERLLVMENRTYTLFYTKYLYPIDRLIEMEKKGQKPIKQTLIIANTHAQIDQSTINIRFIKDNIKKTWSFRFANEKLAIKWLVLYKDMYEKSIAKSISKSKQTASNSCSQSNYASILSQSKYYTELEHKKEQQAYKSVAPSRSNVKLELMSHLLAQSVKVSRTQL